MPLLIREGELLVGQRAAHLGARSLYPEYHFWGLNPDNCPAVIWDYWHNRTLGDDVQRAMPERRCCALAKSWQPVLSPASPPALAM